MQLTSEKCTNEDIKKRNRYSVIYMYTVRVQLSSMTKFSHTI